MSENVKQDVKTEFGSIDGMNDLTIGYKTLGLSSTDPILSSFPTSPLPPTNTSTEPSSPEQKSTTVTIQPSSTNTSTRTSSAPKGIFSLPTEIHDCIFFALDFASLDALRATCRFLHETYSPFSQPHFFKRLLAALDYRNLDQSLRHDLRLPANRSHTSRKVLDYIVWKGPEWVEAFIAAKKKTGNMFMGRHIHDKWLYAYQGVFPGVRKLVRRRRHVWQELMMASMWWVGQQPITKYPADDVIERVGRVMDTIRFLLTEGAPEGFRHGKGTLLKSTDTRWFFTTHACVMQTWNLHVLKVIVEFGGLSLMARTEKPNLTSVLEWSCLEGDVEVVQYILGVVEPEDIATTVWRSIFKPPNDLGPVLRYKYGPPCSSMPDPAFKGELARRIYEARNRQAMENTLDYRAQDPAEFTQRERILEEALARKCELIRLFSKKGVAIEERKHVGFLIDIFDTRRFGKGLKRHGFLESHWGVELTKAWWLPNGWTIDHKEVFDWMYLEHLLRALLESSIAQHACPSSRNSTKVVEKIQTSMAGLNIINYIVRLTENSIREFNFRTENDRIIMHRLDDTRYALRIISKLLNSVHNFSSPRKRYSHFSKGYFVRWERLWEDVDNMSEDSARLLLDGIRSLRGVIWETYKSHVPYLHWSDSASARDLQAAIFGPAGSQFDWSLVFPEFDGYLASMRKQVTGYDVDLEEPKYLSELFDSTTPE
ncbi:hypothetical protein BJ508DRAFT_115811 [Ascobolus immersus RN42]|uniref:F-box domain-containing protein n=1 Tax=Ascobolus immersus RN42 TaxID=1160509 RepID=A0A3N4I5B4_ASCIM|nr:hypothetical protein BJ508DRAFT_115811 [Ascobolus immersus RN42]